MGRWQQVAFPSSCLVRLFYPKVSGMTFGISPVLTSCPGIKGRAPQPSSVFPARLEDGFKPVDMEHLEQDVPAGSYFLSQKKWDELWGFSSCPRI